MRYVGTKDSMDELSTQSDVGTAYVDPVEPTGTPEGHLWYDEDETDPAGAASSLTKINAGDGLTGGGDLTIDRTLAVDFNDPRFFTPPIGVIEIWPFDPPAPLHYLMLDGSIYNIADFPVLGPKFGSKYGGNGTTTFGVPDARGKFILGVSAAHILGSTGGVESVTLTAAQSGLPDHMHAIHSATAGAPSGTGDRFLRATTGDDANFRTDSVKDSYAYGSAGTKANSNAQQAHENMPPFMSLNYIIRAL